MTSKSKLRLRDLVEREKSKLGSSWRAYIKLYEEWRDGRLELEDPSPPSSFPGYLARPDYSLWLWSTLAVLLLAVSSIPLSELAPVLLPLRYVLGSVFVLFLPGYTLIEALYPKRESLSPLERLALSIGLSLALVPLVGLLLNYTPFGIRLAPIVASLSVLTAALALVGAWRKFQYAKLAGTK